jgi:hypothetical protein
LNIKLLETDCTTTTTTWAHTHAHTTRTRTRTQHASDDEEGPRLSVASELQKHQLLTNVTIVAVDLIAELRESVPERVRAAQAEAYMLSL